MLTVALVLAAGLAPHQQEKMSQSQINSLVHYHPLHNALLQEVIAKMRTAWDKVHMASRGSVLPTPALMDAEVAHRFAMAVLVIGSP